LIIIVKNTASAAAAIIYKAVTSELKMKGITLDAGVTGADLLKDTTFIDALKKGNI
jgi:hypothetical protein